MANAQAAAAGGKSPVIELAMTLGIGTVLLFMGAVPVLMTLGFVRGMGEIEPAARAILGVFGGVVLFAGLQTLSSPLRAIAAAEGANNAISATILGAWRLVRRINTQSVVSAAFVAPLALSYWYATRGIELGPSRATLQAIVSIEFLVIHGFPFLLLGASLMRVPESKPRLAGAAITLLLGTPYCVFAWSAGRLWGIASLLYLLAPNVAAFALNQTEGSPRLVAIARWATQAVPFFLFAILLNRHDMAAPEVIVLGLPYFAVQTLVELFRVPTLPLDLGQAWARATLRSR